MAGPLPIPRTPRAMASTARGDGVADVEDLHEAFGASDQGRAAEQDAGRDAHDKGGQHGSEDEDQVSLQVKQQIVAVQFDRVDADPVDQQGQEGDDNRSSYQPFAIANSHRRTPLFQSADTFPCGNAMPGCREGVREKQLANAGKTA